ncbi:uncharacterized protein VTP21DRAFT_9519 [Calcarisporiella thermophila]|uniref:uncharacterized protein n=1 Tax=Calcarisporiella thermophila TaxID=911321 RepID=UPI0037448FD2
MSIPSIRKWMHPAQIPTSKSITPPLEIEALYDPNEKYFGLENFGNTCYCNSILQALYYCVPFRDCVENYPSPLPPPCYPAASPPLSSTAAPPPPAATNGHMYLPASILSTPTIPAVNGKKPVPSEQETATDTPSLSVKGMEDGLFVALKDLWWRVKSQPSRTGAFAPRMFISKLRKMNEIFSGMAHQDAHEFLMYILNAVAEEVEAYERDFAAELQKMRSHTLKQQENLNGSLTPANEDNVKTESVAFGVEHNRTTATWIHDLFAGILTNEIKCLTCESVTSRDETFLDISIDIEQHTSVTSCLRQFSASEILCHQNKFLCENCGGLQEAEKRMRIKSLPQVLALHLKRFKYEEKVQRFVKLSYRVVFPLELRLFNTSDDSVDSERLYELYAVVVHIGSGPHHGHYVTLIKSLGQWLIFDDETVETIEESDIPKFFGDRAGTGSGYLLFYQAKDLNIYSLNIPQTYWSAKETQSTTEEMAGNKKEDLETGEACASSSASSTIATATHISTTDGNGKEHLSNSSSTEREKDKEPERSREKEKTKSKDVRQWFLRKQKSEHRRKTESPQPVTSTPNGGGERKWFQRSKSITGNVRGTGSKEMGDVKEKADEKPRSAPHSVRSSAFTSPSKAHESQARELQPPFSLPKHRFLAEGATVEGFLTGNKAAATPQYRISASVHSRGLAMSLVGGGEKRRGRRGGGRRFYTLSVCVYVPFYL